MRRTGLVIGCVLVGLVVVAGVVSAVWTCLLYTSDAADE